jgi:hypothetical protein
MWGGEGKPFTFLELVSWLTDLDQKEWNTFTITQNYEELHIWGIMEIKTHLLNS